MATKNKQKRVIFLPVAHRLPLGFTLIFETLFLSSVKSRVIEDVMATHDTRMKEDRNPALQIFDKVPFIPFKMCSTHFGAS